MRQTDIEALEVVGLRPIIIDENFDFNQLGVVLGLQPRETNEQVGERTEEGTAGHNDSAQLGLPAAPDSPAQG